MSRTGRNFENSRGCIFRTKDDTQLETCEKLFLGVLTPGDDKNLAGLASFDFRFYDVTCKPAITKGI